VRTYLCDFALVFSRLLPFCFALRGRGGVRRKLCTTLWNSGSLVGSEGLLVALIKVDKLDVAIRQLRTAITLWFNDGDPVAIHALAFAAYEVIHVVSKKRNPERRDLLFDSLLIKDENRSEFNIALKAAAYFFKHADRNPDAELEFDPELSDTFILYSICGREQCGAPQSDEESSFMWWLEFQHPEFQVKGRKPVTDFFPVEVFETIRRLPKREFFKTLADVRRVSGKRLAVSLEIV
jgi:hypothetical protein